MNNLLEHYLEPLKRETFLSNAEITALFGNIQEIVTFQRQFLQNLEEALELEPEFHKFEHSSQFKVSVKPLTTVLKCKVYKLKYYFQFYRMYYFLLDRHSCTMLIISNCIHHFVLVTVKPRKFCIQVKKKKFKLNETNIKQNHYR